MSAKQEAKTVTVVIDAAGAVLGRLASFAAKQALLGKKVAIINCKEAVITGSQEDVLKRYRKKIARGGTSQKGPYISRTVTGIARRTVRGMLPWKRKKGKLAYKRVLCYESMPEQFQSVKKITFEKAKGKSITLSQLVKLL